MIKSIRLQNFFGFQDCTINLEKGENVLVGINGSGKSNFFKAIRLLKEGLKEGGLKELFKEWGGFDNVLYIPEVKAKKNITITVDYLRHLFTAGDKKVYRSENYVLVLAPSIFSDRLSFTESVSVAGVKDKSQLIFQSKMIDESPLTKIAKALANTKPEERKIVEDRLLAATNNTLKTESSEIPGARIIFPDIKYYNNFDTLENSKIRRPVPLTKETFLSQNGDNLPLLLYELKNNYRKDSYSKIVAALGSVSNSYSGLDFELFSDHILLKLEEKDFNRPVSALHVSDGTLRFLCLMAILYNPNRGKIVCIDEPELGLHPDMIHTLSEAIKFAAKTSQIIISTHSPQLLDWFDFENVRVFEKDDNNATIVKQLDKEHFKGWYDTYMLGDMWMKGDIGGRV